MADSLQNKLDYLDETKQLIKQALIEKEQEVTDEDTFRSYADKIKDISTGDVKLFETYEEMQADENAKEGDLAIVYRSEIQNATVDSQFQAATFPKTVVLPEAITDYAYVNYRAVDNSVMFDCFGSLDSNYFMMDCYTESNSIRINYASEDGITYTRTDSGDETIDFGTEICYANADYWNEAIGYFIQLDGSTFEGIYNYCVDVNDTSTLAFPLLSSITANNEVLTFGGQFKEFTKIDALKQLILKIKEDENYTDSCKPCLYYKNDVLYAIGYTANSGRDFAALSLEWDIDTERYYFTHGSSNKDSILYKLDVDNQTYDKLTLEEYTIQMPKPLYISYDVSPDTTDICFGYSYDKWEVNLYDIFAVSTVNSKTYYDNPTVNLVLTPYKQINTYCVAPTQLTLKEANELLPGKIGYGKNGVVTGDDSVYQNLANTGNIDNLITSIFGINDKSSLDDCTVNILSASSTLPKIARLCISDKTKDTSDYIIIGDTLKECQSIDYSGKTNLDGSSRSTSLNSEFICYRTSSHALIYGMVDDDYIMNILPNTSTEYSHYYQFKHNGIFYSLRYAESIGYNLYIDDISTIGVATTKYTINATSGQKTLGIGYHNGYVYYSTESDDSSNKIIKVHRINMDTGISETIYTNTDMSYCIAKTMTTIDDICYIRFISNTDTSSFICIKILTDNSYVSTEYIGPKISINFSNSMFKYHDAIYMITPLNLYKLNDKNSTFELVEPFPYAIEYSIWYQVGDIIWDSTHHIILNVNEFMDDRLMYWTVSETTRCRRLILNYNSTKALYYNMFNEGSPIKGYQTDILFAHSVGDASADIILFSDNANKALPVNEISEKLGYTYKVLNATTISQQEYNTALTTAKQIEGKGGISI